MASLESVQFFVVVSDNRHKRVICHFGCDCAHCWENIILGHEHSIQTTQGHNFRDLAC